MTALRQDIRYGWRIFWKQPGFTIVATLSLALGIGANTTIFSIIDATLFSELTFPQADRLMVLYSVPLNRRGVTGGGASAGNYVAWKERTQSFSAMGAMYSFPSNLGAESDRSPAERSSANMLLTRCSMSSGLSP